MADNFNINLFLKTVPHLPGIYKHIDSSGTVIYVGKARDLKKRVSSYFNKKLPSARIEKMVSNISSIEITITKSEIEALILENNLIKSLKPKYNIVFRDDKTYPYLKFTFHRYPRLMINRLSYSKTQKVDGRYFGPFPDIGGARETIKILQKIFCLRTCEDSVFANRSRPCLLGQIKRCSAPCVGAISVEEYADNVNESLFFLSGKTTKLLTDIKQKMYSASESMNFEVAAKLRDQIKALKSVLHKQTMENIGVKDTDIIAISEHDNRVCINVATVRNGRHIGDKHFLVNNEHRDIIEELLKVFLEQYYLSRDLPNTIISSHKLSKFDTIKLIEEKQSKKVSMVNRPKGTQHSWLKQALENSKLFLDKFVTKQDLREARIKALIKDLSIPVLTKEQLYIECFDISHHSGEETQASCVVFKNCNMQPSLYRRYKIANILPGDDFAAMGQVLYRRFSNLKERDTPNLVLIDGGEGQVNVAKKIFEELCLNISLIVGVSKGEKRKVGLEVLHFADGRNSMSLGIESPALMLIAYIRDEAHRFAITGVRNSLNKLRSVSTLTSIDGIGKKRSQALIKHFGSLHDISSATIEEIMSVDGISKSLAEKIYEFVNS